MRIISGKFKGKNFQFLGSRLIRPLKDSVKENIFNVIKHSNKINILLKDSNILDLYSGIGSFGLECISLGAKKVTFVEQNEEAAKMLNDNLKNLPVYLRLEYLIKKLRIFLKQILKKSMIYFSLIHPLLTKTLLII